MDTVDSLRHQALWFSKGKRGTVNLNWGYVAIPNVTWSGALRLKQEVERMRGADHVGAVRLFLSRLIYRTMNS